MNTENILNSDKIESLKLDLKKKIIEKVFVNLKGGQDKDDFPHLDYIFDFRKVSLNKDFLETYTNIFKEIFENYPPFQICGLETAAIPLLTAISFNNKKNINAFYIRKSRKKHDLTKDIEGNIENLPIVIIDDILNSGNSIKKQIQILKREGLVLDKIFTILRFRDSDFYNYLKQDFPNLEIVTLFELNDFKNELGLTNKKEELIIATNYKILWAKKFGKTDFQHVVPKSQMLLEGDRLYFGTDSGVFYCIDKNTREEVWSKKVLFGSKGKTIFSNPAIFENRVFFGAYDGNFYCLDKNTGKQIWIYLDADWIGSSPCISIKEKKVFIGLEYGLINKKGGLACLDIETGKEAWKDIHFGLTHCSPYVSEQNNLVFCGANDGILRIYNAKTGEKEKEISLSVEMKACFTENADHTKIAFGAFDGYVYIVDTKSLEIVDKFETLASIYSSPVFFKDLLLITSLDKNIYTYDTISKKLLWKFATNARIFTDAKVFQNIVYVGNNAGVLYKIDLLTGKLLGYLQFAERLLTSPIFETPERLYVQTQANEIYFVDTLQKRKS